jgi:hypothetical protein
MNTLRTIAAAFALLPACSTSSEPPRDPYVDANNCAELAAGRAPTKLIEGDEMFNAGQLTYRDGRLFVRISAHNGFKPAVISHDLARGYGYTVTDAEAEQLAVGPKSVFWFENWRGLYRRQGNAWAEGWDIGEHYIDAMVADPVRDGVWFTKASGVKNDNGALYYFEGGSLTEIARGSVDHALAVTVGAVWVVTRANTGASAEGELTYWKRGTDEWKTLLAYNGKTIVDLRADETGAVYMFSGDLGAATEAGTQTLHSGGAMENLAIDATYAYFTQKTSFGGAVRRVRRDGSAPAETLAEMRCTPRSLAVGEERVFFTTYAWDTHRAAPGAVWALDASQ